MNNFKSISYLKQGNPKQRCAYNTLTDLHIFEHLKEFNPILVGTIPIKIDIPKSDLDIICHCTNHHRFSQKPSHYFNTKRNYTISTYYFENSKVTLASFNFKKFTIEIFGQNIPTEQQNAYKHLIIENHILKEKGSEFASKIITLKKSGLKTEPAFAQLLQLKGNPYKELITMYDYLFKT